MRGCCARWRRPRIPTSALYRQRPQSRNWRSRCCAEYAGSSVEVRSPGRHRSGIGSRMSEHSVFCAHPGAYLTKGFLRPEGLPQTACLTHLVSGRDGGAKTVPPGTHAHPRRSGPTRLRFARRASGLRFNGAASAVFASSKSPLSPSAAARPKCIILGRGFCSSDLISRSTYALARARGG